eukprot:TRINITY_DN11190_c0_g1_i1.p1 TRINITY_DN11190_c0_g1~~TRINITY_DN11190_c0_g1_i1.p1  ORF type:complete len:253 (-),score=35.92 TRINITY_DN11190_c0_g1_i1:223-981(-)
MHRRPVGIAGLQQKKIEQERLKKQAEQISEDQLKKVQEQVSKFKENLELFATKYKKSINKEPAFRQQFTEMCKTIGVDPLTSSKGFWAQMLGVGDFYYELGIQIVEVCMQTRRTNGGMIELQQLLSILTSRRGPNASNISSNDIEKAVSKLQVLGNGFKILSLGSRKILQSVPVELSNDQIDLIFLAQENGFITPKLIQEKYGWDLYRINVACQHILSEGLVWLDAQTNDGEPSYWLLSLNENESTLSSPSF